MNRAEIRALVALYDREAKRLSEIDEGSSCLNCLHWHDGCAMAEGARPPADIIVQGCDEWQETIPPTSIRFVKTSHVVPGKSSKTGWDDLDDDIPF